MLELRVQHGLRIDKDPTPHGQQLRAFGLGGEDLAAWRESGLGDEGFGDWLTARERAPGAEVFLARAEALSFADESFTAVATVQNGGGRLLTARK